MRLGVHYRRWKWRWQQGRLPWRSRWVPVAIVVVPLAIAALYPRVAERFNSLPSSNTSSAPRFDARTHSKEIVGSAYVVDGDTLRVRGERIRLHGIDAPEKDQLCRKEGRAYQCGQAATQALRDKIDNRAVRCAPEGRDRYNRIIAVCRLRGEDLGAWMVSEGHALAYRKYSSAYITRDVAASTLNRGMWQGDFVPPWDWRRGKRS